MPTTHKILILGASYGSLLGTKLALAGHTAHLVCLPAEADLINSEGAIVRKGLSKVAAYRDDQGKLFLRSARCPHLGCHVHWNSFERCWDCPCHGSQFAPDGTALNGPAFSALEEIKP